MKRKDAIRLSKWANSNDPKAQFKYGYALLTGDGVKKNEQKGLYYIVLAGDNGSKEAIDFLEQYYFDDNASTQAES